MSQEIIYICILVVAVDRDVNQVYYGPVSISGTPLLNSKGVCLIMLSEFTNFNV